MGMNESVSEQRLDFREGGGTVLTRCTRTEKRRKQIKIKREREGERERKSARVCVCVWERQRESVCVRVRERESEEGGERERAKESEREKEVWVLKILARSGFTRMPESTTACLVRLRFNGAFAGRPVTPRWVLNEPSLVTKTVFYTSATRLVLSN